MRSGSAYGKPDDTRGPRLATLARSQHGVVSASQLQAIGYTPTAIHRRVQSAVLHRLHRGVYAVGHTKLSIRARWMAAVLAGGAEAVLSHRAAGALWEIRAAPSGPIDVTSPSRHGIAGIRCHLAPALHSEDRTTIDCIPVTSIERTFLDLAEELRPQPLRTDLEAAQRAGLLHPGRLQRCLERNGGRHGLRPLREAFAQLHDEAPWTQSKLERDFLELVRDAGLSDPQCNVIVDDELVDFFWPAHNLVVEVDGFLFHRTRRPFEDDRRRDAKHAVAGRLVLRVTERRMKYDRRQLTGDLSKLLSP